MIDRKTHLPSDPKTWVDPMPEVSQSRNLEYDHSAAEKKVGVQLAGWAV